MAVYMKLIRSVQRFMAWPYRRKKLFCFSWILLGLSKSLIVMIPYRSLSKYWGTLQPSWTGSVLLSMTQYDHVNEIKRMIALASRYTPWLSTCLMQAMVATWWCQKAKIPYLLYIGVTPETVLNHTAHAWVTSGPIFITGGDGFATHRVLCCYRYSSTYQKT